MDSQGQEGFFLYTQNLTYGFAFRLQEQAEMLDKDLESYETLFQRRQQKELLVKGAAKFDENPKAGLVYLEGTCRVMNLWKSGIDYTSLEVLTITL